MEAICNIFPSSLYWILKIAPFNVRSNQGQRRRQRVCHKSKRHQMLKRRIPSSIAIMTLSGGYASFSSNSLSISLLLDTNMVMMIIIICSMCGCDNDICLCARPISWIIMLLFVFPGPKEAGIIGTGDDEEDRWLLPVILVVDGILLGYYSFACRVVVGGGQAGK